MTLAKLSNNPILVAPTGSGKTVMGCAMVRAFTNQNRKVLWLAHRKELIEQAAATLAPYCNYLTGIIMAGYPEAPMAAVQVASVQTLIRRSLPDADLIIVDEAHHATADAYTTIIKGYPDTPRIGLTATPFRLDGRGLGDVFGDLVVAAYTDDLCAVGVLHSPKVYAGHSPDLRGVKKSMGDYVTSALVDRMNQKGLVGDIVETWQAKANGKKTVAFAVNVDHSKHIVEQFTEAGIRAEHIDGSTPKHERTAILARLRSSETQIVSNCMILCLDDATEILTASGWKTSKTIDKSSLVANWDNGNIWFERPTDIVVRARGQNERMVILETPRRSIRVTEGHWILYRKSNKGRWCKDQARNLVGKRYELPVSGYSEPIATPTTNPQVSQARRAKLVTKTAYNLRKLNGFNAQDSRIEASRRVDRKLSLARKVPSQLTNDECEFIGFWIGDGTATKLKTGGVEYSISQSVVYTQIIKYLDGLISRCGFDCVKRDASRYDAPHYKWSFGRGTGGGRQQRKGLFSIEPYLDKNGSSLLWGLDKKQFDAFVFGFWLADGLHGNSSKRPVVYSISNTCKPLLDLIQAVAVCRGYRASITIGSNHKISAKHKIIYNLRLRKTSSHAMTKHCLRFEDGFKPEQVWCVKTQSKNIITRRNGKVTIMGNTEGWDLPSLECAIIARPTASLNLHLQMLGRIMRAADGKDGCIVLDHAGNHHMHGLVTRRLEYSLNGKLAGEKDPLGLRRCGACQLLFDPKLDACPECGWMPPKQETAIPQGKGVLGEFQEDFTYRREMYRLWASQAEDAGFKPGWVLYRYKERFGAWPVTATINGVTDLVDPHNALPEEKKECYRHWAAFAAERGFKPGWAAHQYKNFFGVWPSGFVSEVREELGISSAAVDRANRLLAGVGAGANVNNEGVNTEEEEEWLF